VGNLLKLSPYFSYTLHMCVCVFLLKYFLPLENYGIDVLACKQTDSLY